MSCYWVHNKKSKKSDMVAVLCNLLATLKNQISVIAIIGKASTSYQQCPNFHSEIPVFLFENMGLFALL